MRKLIAWLIVVLWMILIFYFSQQPAFDSKGLSTTISKQLIDVVEKVTPLENLHEGQVDHIVRKNAHFTIYFFLGIFALLALKLTGLKHSRSAIIALVLCMIYAVTDEYHQLFVEGRGAQLKDIFIDWAGAATGITVATLLGLIGKNGKARSENRKTNSRYKVSER
ncbi:MAG: VanZ family protein [Solibacillus isronensis]